jgi:hypothetical protein
VYAATIDSVRYTFQASGSLWQDALVMQDFQTGSLWAQVLGEAIRGELEGTVLELFPSQHMDFAEFAKRFPHGMLLEKPARGQRGSGYDSYFADPERLGIFGRMNTFSRLKAKALVYGLSLTGSHTAVSKDHLIANRLVQLRDSSAFVIVLYDESTRAASAYRVPKQAPEISFSDNGNLISSDGRQWNPATGRSQDERGPDLEPVPLLTAYWFAWVTFFPDTDLIN